MSVIKKEIKRKFLYLSAYFYKVSELFWGQGGWAPFRVGVGVLIYFESLPFCKNKPHYNHKTNVQRDSLKMLNRCKLKVSKEKLTRLPHSIRKIFIKPVTFLGFEGNILFVFLVFHSRAVSQFLSLAVALTCGISRSCCPLAHHYTMKTILERINANISTGKIRKY